MAMTAKKPAAEKMLVKKMSKKGKIEYLNSLFSESCGELTDLLRSLFEKTDADLYSGVEAIYKDYVAAYSDFLTSNFKLQKYKQSNEFDIKDTIPDSCFVELNKRRDWRDSDEEIQEKTLSSCQEYSNSVFETAKKDFLLETEKCKAFYLERLLELQDTVKEKLTAAKHIEQEILVLEKNIECLDELQNEINKAAAN